MKGQFFIVGGLLVCALLFFGMGAGMSMSRSSTTDMQRMADNVAREVPRALNIGINSSDPVGVLENFTAFWMGIAGGRRMGPSCYWAVFRPDGDYVNVSVGNFLGSTADFGVNVSDDYDVIQVTDGSVGSSLFTASGYSLNATVTVGGGSSGAVLLRNKTSVIGEVSLERGGNILKKEILA
jgi:hypothetical protein